MAKLIVACVFYVFTTTKCLCIL